MWIEQNYHRHIRHGRLLTQLAVILLTLAVVEGLVQWAPTFVFFHVLAILPVILTASAFGIPGGIVMALVCSGFLAWDIALRFPDVTGGTTALAGFVLMNVLVAVAIGRQERFWRLLEDKERELEALYDLTHKLSQTLDLEDFLEQASDVLREHLTFSYITLLLYDPEKEELEIKEAVGYDQHDREIEGMHIPIERGVTGKAARQRQTVLVDDVREEESYVMGEERVRSEVAIPLIRNEKLIGVFNVESAEVGAVGKNDLKMLQALADDLTLALERVQLIEELQVQATTDSLTGLYNYGFFKSQLQHEIARAQRYQHPVSLAMMDIDDFKAINDHYGHPFGDQILVRCAEILRSEVRTTDLLCRYGGEEFAIILPQTGWREAAHCAERIRSNIENQVMISKRDRITFTSSVGVATFPQDGSDWNDLLSAADKALYEAKDAGKNQVVVSEAIG